MERGTKSALKIIFGILAFAAGIYLAIVFFDLLVMLAISILIAMIFNPLISILEQQGMRRNIAVLIVLGLAAFLIVLGISVFVPTIVTQMNALTSNISQEKISNVLGQIQSSLGEYIPFLDTTDFAAKLSEFFSSLFFSSIDNISHIVSQIVSILAIAVIVPFMTYFLLKDNKRIIKGLINIMPNRYFEMSYSVIHEISIQLGRFVRGWIFDAFVVGALSAIGLSILGIKNSVTIGFVAGIGHLIPYFGPIVGGLPAIIISIVQFGNLSMLPSIIIMFLAVYTIDNGFIQPNVFSKSVDLHPLAIIILIIVGSQVMGVFGMLLAVPVATVIRTAAKEIYLGYKKYKIIKA